MSVSILPEFENIQLDVSGVNYIMTPGKEQAAAYLFCLDRCISGWGVIISRIPISGILADYQTLSVSDQVFTDLGVADLAEYEVLRAEPDFIHEDDIDLAITHAVKNSTAPYTIRFKRGNGKYRRMRTHGFSITANGVQLRITLLRAEGAL